MYFSNRPLNYIWLPKNEKKIKINKLFLYIFLQIYFILNIIYRKKEVNFFHEGSLV